MLRAVDDELATYKIMKKFLHMTNMPLEIVGVAEDGLEALALIQREAPDIIFMDICMPYMSGFEVIEQLQNVNVIVITAFNSFENAQQALRLGAKDILLKPIDLAQLTEAIARVVGWKFTSNDTINFVLEYIHRHYAEKINLTTFAKLCFCTESHFARLFKKYMGISTMLYIHKVRIHKAADLINHGHSIQNVANEVGYQNINSFYKYFKVFMQDTPGDYCKNSGANEIEFMES